MKDASSSLRTRISSDPESAIFSMAYVALLLLYLLQSGRTLLKGSSQETDGGCSCGCRTRLLEPSHITGEPDLPVCNPWTAENFRSL